MSFSNEERLEEMLIQAHQAGDANEFYDLVRKYSQVHPQKRLIDIYEMAHYELKPNR